MRILAKITASLILLSALAFGQSPQALFHANNVTASSGTPITNIETVCGGTKAVTGCSTLSGSGPYTLNLGTSTTANELIVVLTYYDNAASAGSVSDSGSQTYTIGSSYLGLSSHSDTTIFYKCGSASGITSVTWTPAGGAFYGNSSMVVAHYTGILASGCHDVTVNPLGTGTAAASWTAQASGTLSQAKELVISQILIREGLTSVTLTATSPATLLKYTQGSSDQFVYAMIQNVVNATTSVQAAGTSNGVGTNTFYSGVDTFRGN